MNNKLKIGGLFAGAVAFAAIVEFTNEPIRPDWIFQKESDCAVRTPGSMTADEFKGCLIEPSSQEPN